ncbi:uncharacterized protein F5891DRAFT_986144 [Suillus fuscotomentosus]|uniref:Uncharacterized protein n=1 Tax=Suillus fuscotomentosus TaxID=1912939 RepID=A0AAD4DSL0_9AGAM|nr:uncharacterized protein F5891DRAFT_986144 [Suillus fuscotomentosus]KAG1893150.1 hypothetical protein F5891DRAFT_986144 [Suillus fuscotomentosus]
MPRIGEAGVCIQEVVVHKHSIPSSDKVDVEIVHDGQVSGQVSKISGASMSCRCLSSHAVDNELCGLVDTNGIYIKGYDSHAGKGNCIIFIEKNIPFKTDKVGQYSDCEIQHDIHAACVYCVDEVYPIINSTPMMIQYREVENNLKKNSPAQTATQSDHQTADSVATMQNRKSAPSRRCTPVLFFHKKKATVGSHQSNKVLAKLKGWKRLTDNRKNDIDHFKNVTSLGLGLTMLGREKAFA